jgi:hypothetical protein
MLNWRASTWLLFLWNPAMAAWLVLYERSHATCGPEIYRYCTVGLQVETGLGRTGILLLWCLGLAALGTTWITSRRTQPGAQPAGRGAGHLRLVAARGDDLLREGTRPQRKPVEAGGLRRSPDSDALSESDEAPREERSLQKEAVLESLARRARPRERPEELLFDLGLIEEHDFALELACRTGRPFAGLRGFAPDPRLFAYLPLPIAMRERVCPLVLVGDSLKLATAFLDPDLSYTARLFPSLQVELTIAPRSEILEALSAATDTL